MASGRDALTQAITLLSFAAAGSIAVVNAFEISHQEGRQGDRPNSFGLKAEMLSSAVTDGGIEELMDSSIDDAIDTPIDALIVESTGEFPDDRAIAPLPSSASKLVVDLSDRQLTLQRQGHPDQTFPIAVGRVGWETPVGTFEVVNKQMHPSWQHPITREIVPSGAANPLGTRWIGFWTDGRNQLGFHGTNEADQIGQAASHGCIRMRNRHIQEVYALVDLGTPVTIQP